MVAKATVPPEPPRLPPPDKKLERRIVIMDKRGIPTIIGLSYLFEPPLELMVRRGKRKEVCCFMVGMNKRAAVYQEPLD